MRARVLSRTDACINQMRATYMTDAFWLMRATYMTDAFNSLNLRSADSTTTSVLSYPLSHRWHKTGNTILWRILCKYWRLRQVILLTDKMKEIE